MDLWYLEIPNVSTLIKPHIGSFRSGESHHSWLSTGSLRARWARATVLTSGTLSKPQGKKIANSTDTKRPRVHHDAVLAHIRIIKGFLMSY